MPTRKWKDAHRNFSPGDIVLIQYTSILSPGTYRLGKVMTVEKDADELVRTCTVKYVLCNGDVGKKAVAKEMRVPIQSLIIILPFYFV